MNVLWYLSRGSGVAAAVLLAAVLTLGVARSERWHRPVWPWLLTTHLHRRLSTLLIVVVVLHVMAVVLDGYAPVALWDAVIPFLSDYRRVWTGLGTVSLDVLIAIVLTSSSIRALGYPVWKTIHRAGYLVGALVLLHGLGDGSDARSLWALALLLAVALACTAAPLWRLAGRTLGEGSLELALRLAGGAVAVGAVVAIAGFAQAGPLQPGWARVAGTPARLVGGQAAPAADDGRSLPRGVDDRLQGARQPSANGASTLVLVDERDPSITLTIGSGVTAGGAAVTIARSGVAVCFGTPVVGRTLIFDCDATAVTITLDMEGSAVGGGMVTAPAAG